MPLPSHRLDLAIVPGGDRLDRAAVDGLVADLVGGGVFSDDGLPGPHATDLVSGGFVRWRVDDPGRVVLYANQQGGFGVRCPACGANVVPAFNAAWPGGSALTCGTCATTTALPALDFRPPAAFGPGALVLADVGAASLTVQGHARVAAALGSLRVIGRRVG